MRGVETTGGRVAGQRVGGVWRFLGLRYGEDTGGFRRFHAPQAARPRAGLYQAVSPGPSAPQAKVPQNTDPFFAWYSAIGTVSEDCLFLNLYTPALTGKRPVLVWLHGGGWTSYSGTAPGFDGSRLAAHEDVVVVTLNHRLGVFGHLAFPDQPQFADSGNAGLLDIVLALEWLRDNIAAFGGDPGCVTLIGQSGGGAKVAALMAMPAARGLFHRAALHSIGSALTVAEPDEAALVARGLGAALGMDRLDPVTLQSLPMERLIAASAKAPPARAMLDGRHLSTHPFDGQAPAQAAGIPLLIGCTNTECSYYLRDDPANFTMDIATARRRLERFLDLPPRRVAMILDACRAATPGLSPSDLLILAASEQMFKRPAHAVAALQSASARAPVFVWQFDWESPVEGGRMRGPHTVELPFLFGSTAAAAACVGKGSPRMERLMMASWAAFARTGRPQTILTPDWHPYDAADRWTMHLNDAPHLDRDPADGPRALLSDLPFYRYGQSMATLARD